MKKDDIRSKQMMFWVSVIWGSIAVVRQMIPWPTALVAACRGLAGALIMLLLIKIRGQRFRSFSSRHALFLVLLSGIFLGLNWLLIYESYRYIPISIASVLYNTAPFFAMLLFPIFLREKIKPLGLCCGLIAVLGTALLSGNLDWSPGGSAFKGMVLSLGAAVFYALLIILNIKTAHEPATETTVLELGMTFVIMLPYCFTGVDFSALDTSAKTFFWLAVVCLIQTGLAYGMYFEALKGLTSMTATLMNYIAPVVSVILAVVILHEKIGIKEIIGTILVIGAALYYELKNAQS